MTAAAIGSTQHLATCPLCEAMCGIVVTKEGQRIGDIRGDPLDPLSRGHLCPKARAIPEILDDPDRLKQPVKRTARGFEPISWEEAFRLASQGIVATRKAHGRDALAVYIGNPVAHNYGVALYGIPTIELLKTKNRFSATSVDNLPRMVASYLLYGHQVLLPVPDLDRTDFLLILGANPAVSNGSIMSAPGAARRIAAVRQRGGRVVVVDPRRTETAALADEHLFVRPGSDALLLLALLHVIFDEKLERPGRLAARTDGLDVVRALARRFPPERVAAATGIAAEATRRLARAFATARTAVAYGRMGVCTQEFGTLATWLGDVLNLVTGNLDRAGGAMFTRPAADVLSFATLVGLKGHRGRWKSRARGLPEFAGELPVAAFAEEMEAEGPGQIRSLLTAAGNPVLSCPNGTRIERALAKLDFMVSIDFYVTETTRHAHVILPPTFALERDHYDLALHAVAVRNTAKMAEAVLPKSPDARHDWEIWLELGSRILAAESPVARALAPAARWLGRRLEPRGLLEILLRLGPHRLSLAKLAKSPHGLDLGALEPCLPGRLGTPDKRIRLAPAELVLDLARLEASLDRKAPALALIGRRHLRSNNSWMHNAPGLHRGRDACTLLMHPDDARARSLVDGALVSVSSRAGHVEVPLEVSDEVMPGVVSLPHGWGHGRPGVGLRVAAARPGASANDITDDQLVDAFSGNASLSGVPVEVASVVEGSVASSVAVGGTGAGAR